MNGLLTKLPNVGCFIAISTKIHPMAPAAAGLDGSIFFGKGQALFMESQRLQGRSINVFVCHHQEADHCWEYCGRYEIANFHAIRPLFKPLVPLKEERDNDVWSGLTEGKDDHGDVWHELMSEDVKEAWLEKAAASQHGWFAYPWIEKNQTKWKAATPEEKKQILAQLFNDGKTHTNRISLKFVDYDEELYERLVDNELNSEIV